MRTTVFAISSLLAGIGLIMIGNGLLGTLLGVRMSIAETPALVSGIIMASYFGGFVAGSLGASRLISVVGHIRAFSALASIYSAAALLHALQYDALLWALLRMTQGLCMAGIFMCVESWLNARAPNETRGRVVSIYMIVVYLAQAFGQLLLMAFTPETFVLFVIVSAIASLGVVPIALTRQPQPEMQEVERLPLGIIYEISPLGVIGAFASGIVLGAFYGMGPVFAPRAGLDVDGTAAFMALAIVGGLAMQWPIGQFSDRVDRRHVILWMTILLAAIGMVLAAATGRSPVILLIGITAFGACCFALYPVAVAHANDFADETRYVGIAGGLLLAYSVGATIGPLAAAAFMALLGPGGLFVFLALTGIAISGFALWRMKQGGKPDEQTRGRFVALPRTSPISSQMAPAAPDPEAAP